MNGTEQERLGHDDRFVIKQRLGAGATGVVYRALDRVRHHEVAIKFLKHVDGDTLYRFKNEFRALADLVHPNLVSLHELLSLGDEWYFTMDLIDGVPFDQFLGVMPVAGEEAPTQATLTSSSGSAPEVPGQPLARPRVPMRHERLERLWPTLEQLTEGVGALHRAGKLHRDIKPSNVLVTPSGRVVLCDFGLVAEVPGAGDPTVEYSRAGTPAYMSPEQAAGQPLSEATDWYSVGVMLYQVLTGRLPFAGDAATMRLRRTRAEPPSPRHWVPALPVEVDGLCAALLRRDPAARAGERDILALCGRRGLAGIARAPSSEPSGTVALAAPFVGRAHEQHLLHEALATSRRGHSVAVFVHGLSGIGKTALVRRFLDEIVEREHAVVLAGRCYERESMPYKALDAVIDALSAHLRRLPSDEVERLLPQDVTLLARLFPVLRRVAAIGQPARRSLETPDPHEARRRGMSALRELLARLAERWPVVLFIDDLQWGDIDSAPFLIDLMEHADAPPVLLVASLRREDIETSPLLRRLREGRVAGDVRDVALEPLTPTEAEALGRELLSAEGSETPERAARIARESGGSPLFVQELARAGSSDEGVGLEKVLRRRIEQLSAPARALITAVAVAGRPTALEIVARCAGLTDVPALVSELRASRLLRTRGSHGAPELECFHDRIRETILAQLGDDERRRNHRGLAEAIEASGGAGADPQALVEHFTGAGENRRAQRYAVLAATRAEEAFAFHRAVDHLVLALGLGALDPVEERRLRARLADALAHAGRLAEAAQAFCEAAVGAAPIDALELRRRATESLLLAGRLQEGLEMARTVAREVGLNVPRTMGRALVAVLVGRIRVRARGLDFVERRAEDVAPEALRRLDVCWSLSNGLSFVNPTIGLSFQARHLLEALRAGEPSRVALALCTEIGYRSLPGTRCWPESEALCAHVSALAERGGNPEIMAICASCVGLANSLSGRWRAAAEHFTRAVTMFRDHGTPLRYAADLAEVYQLSALLYLGETRELVRLLPRYLQEASERGDQYAATRLRTWRSNCAWLVLDRPDEARRMANDSPLPSIGGGFHLHHYFELLANCRIDLYLGDGESAWRRLEATWPQLAHSRLLRVQSLRIEAHALRAACALAAPAASTRARATLLAVVATSAKQVERDHAPWGDALATLLRASVHAARGERGVAADLLGAAAAAFDGADMALHAAIARRRRGELLGDDEGRKLVDAATQWMKHQGVVRPARLTAMFAPAASG